MQRSTSCKIRFAYFLFSSFIIACSGGRPKCAGSTATVSYFYCNHYWSHVWGRWQTYLDDGEDEHGVCFARPGVISRVPSAGRMSIWRMKGNGQFIVFEAEDGLKECRRCCGWRRREPRISAGRGRRRACLRASFSYQTTTTLEDPRLAHFKDFTVFCLTG